MTDTNTSIDGDRRVAVVGGGFSGLAAAHRLLERAPHWTVTLFEAGQRVGGVVHSVRKDGYLIEGAADMLTTKEPWGVDLCRRIGFLDQLIETNEGKRRAFVVRRGRLHPVPEGFTLMTPVKTWPMVTTRLLSPWGKLRLACELFLPARRDESDESLESFATRRMGREGYERLIQPLISSIYTADPTRLSMQAAMPQFVALERKYGSLARGMRKMSRTRPSREAGSGARYSLFVTARNGLSTLVDALAARLPEGCIRLESPVERLTRRDQGSWSLQVREAESRSFDAVILATPAPQTAELLEPIDAPLAAQIRGIELAGTTIVACGYRREQIRHPLDGFGVVAPLAEQRRVLSISFSSIKFNGRAPQGSVLFRVFVGGACQAELAELPDDEIRQMVRQELEELLGARGEMQLCEIFRWPRTMPQYYVGHLERAARIEQRAAHLTDLALAGNAYRGVGIPFCIRSGEAAAERLLGAPQTAAQPGA